MNSLSVTGVTIVSGGAGAAAAAGHRRPRRAGADGAPSERRRARRRATARRAPDGSSSRFLPALSTIEGLNAPSAENDPEPRLPEHDHAVLVVDFGAQYAQLIARRVRELAVYSEIVPNRITAAEVAERRPTALILSGGPKSVHVDGAPSLDPAIYELGIPILGICYGAQLIAQQLGGTVGRGMRGEYGRAKLRRTGPSLLLPDDAPDVHDVWMSHFDAITEAPDGLHRDGGHRRRPRRRAGGRRAADLRRAVPPRGRPLAVRDGRAAAVPPRAGGVPADVDDVVGHRRAGRPHPRRGRRRPRALRAVRRRRLVGRRRARPPGRRSPADVHLRRHRADAQGRERPGHRDVPAGDGHRADPRRRRRALLRPPGRRRSTPRTSARPSATSSSASSRSTPAGSSRPSSSSRARCTPTSSSPAAPTARRR